MLEVCPKCWWKEIATLEREYRCLCWYRHGLFSDARIPDWYEDWPQGYLLDKDRVQQIWDEFDASIQWKNLLVYIHDEQCEPCKFTDKIIDSLSPTIQVIKKEMNTDVVLMELINVQEAPMVLLVIDGAPADYVIWWKEWYTEEQLQNLFSKLPWYESKNIWWTNKWNWPATWKTTDTKRPWRPRKTRTSTV